MLEALNDIKRAETEIKTKAEAQKTELRAYEAHQNQILDNRRAEKQKELATLVKTTKAANRARLEKEAVRLQSEATRVQTQLEAQASEHHQAAVALIIERVEAAYGSR